MTLGFTTTHNKKPTYFAERVWKAIAEHDIPVNAMELAEKSAQLAPEEREIISRVLAKIHTIRDDRKNLWQSDKVIHPVIHNRTKNRRQFAPCFKCTGVQDVFMTYSYGNLIQISVDDRELFSYTDRLEFAINDGFDSWDDFFNWFYPIIMASEGKSYSGKLIHFTKSRY